MIIDGSFHFHFKILALKSGVTASGKAVSALERPRGSPMDEGPLSFRFLLSPSLDRNHQALDYNNLAGRHWGQTGTHNERGGGTRACRAKKEPSIKHRAATR